jgi:hypothetical protein
MSRAHHVLGDIALLGRDHQTAREHYQAALELPQASPTSTPVLLRSLGDVAGIAGDVAEQEAAYRDALSQVIAIGSTFEMARTRVALGWLLTGRVSAEAIDVLRAGWQDALDVGAAGAAVAAAAGLGVLAVNQRRPVDGVLLVAAAEAYGQRHGTSVTGALNDYFGLDRVLEAALTQARSELGDSTYAEAWRRGAAGDVADVIAEIYGEVISARPL